jgi:hypothetical protein
MRSRGLAAAQKPKCGPEGKQIAAFWDRWMSSDVNTGLVVVLLDFRQVLLVYSGKQLHMDS